MPAARESLVPFIASARLVAESFAARDRTRAAARERLEALHDRGRRIYTAAVVRLIRERIKQGVRSGAIAREIGVEKRSLKEACYRLKIKLRRPLVTVQQRSAAVKHAAEYRGLRVSKHGKRFSVWRPAADGEAGELHRQAGRWLLFVRIIDNLTIDQVEELLKNKDRLNVLQSAPAAIVITVELPRPPPPSFTVVFDPPRLEGRI